MELRRHPDRAGLDIYDPIENVRFALFTPEPVRPTPVETTSFYFPVDAAVAIETTALEIPKLAPLTIRRRDGTMVAETSDGRDRTLDADSYLVELSTAPMKLYLAVESASRVEHTDADIVFRFGEETTVRVGARSYHERPAGTITVTDDVEDAMRAISLFGSALKTTSPERSFPTLRGHPPLVKLGESFSAPARIERPETGVELVVPPDREHVYPAASLAYYLGAKLVPGTDPRLVADGFERSLDGPGGYEATVNRAFRQTFFLDCLVRTEGYYRVDLHERQRVEPLVDLDFADLYDAPMPERLERYLSVPFETLEPYVPNWRLGVDVTPTVENVEYAPYLARDLALVRIPERPNPQSVSPMSDAQTEFFRAPPSGALARGSDGWDAVDDRDVFQVDSIPNVIEQAWAGMGYPLEVNKLDVRALRRRVDRQPSSDTIDIHVVCNDERMQDEDVVRDLYGVRDLLRFEVTAHYDLTRDEFAELLGETADFLHYIGHVDGDGFLCADGSLDARSLDDVRVKAFLLNACASYEQGHELVKKGSHGGVATLSPVGNPMATELGQILARLLNCGFSLRAGLAIAQRHAVHGYQYIVLGDGGVTLVQSESGVPLHLRVEPLDDGRFDVEVNAYPNDLYGMGTMNVFHADSSNTRYLSSAPLTTVRLSAQAFDSSLESETMPVEVEDGLYWSDELSAWDIDG
ncbi:hypothetical protein [Haladaptatus salinisoli]|uniref:hypothetical protein n=1 Tax=Haladaptatus salinisoli TaxID=2884876 RepID=UPI001D0B5EC7|nr:hypothetical protein [Haladaptatus salinisoli]